MIKTVYKEWQHPSGELRKMDMSVEVQRLDKTVETHEGTVLQGFWMANNYATGPRYYQCYLREDALAALEAAQADVVIEDGSILMTDAYRSWDTQMAAYESKPGVAVHPSKSKHPLGVAIDVTPHGIEQERMEEILHAHGWVRTVPHEPWHFEFQGVPD